MFEAKLCVFLASSRPRVGSLHGFRALLRQPDGQRPCLPPATKIVCHFPICCSGHAKQWKMQVHLALGRLLRPKLCHACVAALGRGGASFTASCWSECHSFRLLLVPSVLLLLLLLCVSFPPPLPADPVAARLLCRQWNSPGIVPCCGTLPAQTAPSSVSTVVLCWSSTACWALLIICLGVSGFA